MSSLILVVVFAVFFIAIHCVLRFLEIRREEELHEERNYEMLIEALDSKIKTEMEKQYREIE